MKMKKGKISVLRTVGALGGGVAASAVESFMPEDSSDTTNALAVGGVGAVLAAFLGGEVFEGVGAGMLGVAGAKLTSGLFTSDSDSKETGTSGLGLIPGNHAIMGVGRSRNWVRSRAIRGTEEIPTGTKTII